MLVNGRMTLKGFKKWVKEKEKKTSKLMITFWEGEIDFLKWFDLL
jgi:hypothetical protein